MIKDPDRLAALRQYVAAAIDPTSAFQQIAELAAEMFGAPIALVSVIEGDQQIFRGSVGLDLPALPPFMGACEWVLARAKNGRLLVSDVAADDGFKGDPLTTGAPPVGFFAGAILIAPEGQPIGTLCVIDDKPRPDIDEAQMRRLSALAGVAASHARMASEAHDQQQMLEESQERQRWLGLAESVASLGHWRWEIRTGNRWWSDGFFRILGFEPDERPRSTEELYLAIPPDDRYRLHVAMMRARDEGEPFKIEVAVQRADGANRCVLVEGMAQQGADGQPEVLFGVAQDVTEKKAVEERLSRALDAAEAGSRAKAEFLANMSHEIRTPLSAIIGFSGLLMGLPKLPEEARRYADRISTAGQGLMSLVSDILDFSKIDAGQLELHLAPFSVRDLLDDCMGLVQLQASNKNLSLEVEVDATTPEQLTGDRERVRQILLNLLSNAVKFTAEGGVRVNCAYGDKALRIRVTDTGKGLSEDQQARLFQRFFQADATIQRTFGGTGLGLAICRALAELMGGTVGVESQEGVGSSFWVELPMRVSRKAKSGTGAAPSGEAKRLHILIVDDVDVNRELLRTILGSCGHLVEEAPGGAEAVEAAKARVFDLILMDVHMPVMDGIAATRAIRTETKPNKDTPIIALTADARSERVMDCTAAGMNGYLTKPISVVELLSTVESVGNGSYADVAA